MRSILKALMEKFGHTGHSLYDLSGVPSATTYRFLSGSHGEPRSGTIRRWARVYGLTEAQLRGSEPIDDLEVEKPGNDPLALESVLTNDELTAIEGMRKLDKDIRHAWLKIGKELCARVEQQKTRDIASEEFGGLERRSTERRNSPVTGATYSKQRTGGLTAVSKKAS